MKKNNLEKIIQIPDMTPEEEAELLAQSVESKDDAVDNKEVLMSDEKASAIASGLASNSTEINYYIQENKEYYQEYLRNPEHKLEVPTNPIHVIDL